MPVTQTSIQNAPTPLTLAIPVSRRPSSSKASTPTSSKPSSTLSSPSTSTMNTGPEPNWPRSWRAYTSLFGCFLLMFNSWGLVNAYGTFATFYKEQLLPGRDLFLFNLIGSTESFIVLVFSFLVGRLLDAGFSRVILAVGFVLVTVGMFMLSLSSGDGGRGEGDYGVIWLTQGLIMGMGMACFFVTSSQIAATWFTKRKSFAIGIVASGASIAGLVYPFVIRELIASLGWTRAVQATAGLTASTALLSVIFAQPNPAHPLNKGDTTKWLSARRWIDPPAFKNATFNWFCAAIALMFFGFYAVFFNLEEWALKHDLGRTNVRGNPTHKIPVFYYLSVMNGASTLGRLSSGYLSDHYGALNVHFVVMLIASLLLLLLWPFAKTIAAAFAFVVVFGVFSGPVIGLPPATMAHIIHHAPGTDHSRMGHWTGMMYTIAAPFALAGPVVAGHLISEYGENYITVQMWSGICLFLSSLCIAAAVYCLRRQERAESGFASSLFDVEVVSRFGSGGVTAVNNEPATRDVSDGEKE